jgi:hypothetical protein
MGLATFWANSLQTHLVTLFAANKQNFISGRFGKKLPLHDFKSADSIIINGQQF